MGRKLFDTWSLTANIFQSILLLAVRLYWGFLFFIGGYYKITNMAPFVSFFHQIGLSSGIAYTVTIIELIAGFLIFFGLLTRLSALCTSVIMFCAYIVAHPGQFLSFFSNPPYFFSAPSFSFLFASLVLFFFGAGIFSIDAIIKRRMNRLEGPPGNSNNNQPPSNNQPPPPGQ